MNQEKFEMDLAKYRWPERRRSQLRMFCAKHASTIVVRMVAVIGTVAAGWFAVFLLVRWTVGVLYHG